MKLLNRFLITFSLIFVFELVTIAGWSYFKLKYDNQIPKVILDKVSVVDERILDTIVLQFKMKNFNAIDLIAYKVLELNSVDDFKIFWKSSLKSIVDSLELNDCRERRNVTVCLDKKSNVTSFIPLKSSEVVIGYLNLKKRYKANDSISKEVLFSVSVTVLTVFVVNLLGLIVFWYLLLGPELKKLLLVFELKNLDRSISITEFNIIQQKFFSILSDLTKSENEKVSLESKVATINLANQVSHDIRSPLEVIKSFKNDFNRLPEEIRSSLLSSVNRIEEITFLLLSKHKKNYENTIASEELVSLVRSVITEKKLEYRLSHILIEFEAMVPFCFSSISRGIFKGIISNLLNNAYDATGLKEGKIVVIISEDGDFNLISVKDYGDGIPDKLKDKIFQKGFSTKLDGHGLGLSSALFEIESIGGSFYFESSKSNGTTFFIKLLKSHRSSAFVNRINLFKYDDVIVLDDDLNFHQIWKSKLKNYHGRTTYFTNFEDFKNFSSKIENFFLITDFDLGSDKLNGFQIIKSQNLSQRSILVTARYEELELRKRCEAEKVKLYSKSEVSLFQIQDSLPTCVLIDDDKLIRYNWELKFRAKNIQIFTFSSIEEFLSCSSDFDKSIFVFIDSNLGNEIKGEIASREIYDLGFQNIYIASGYTKSQIDLNFWIIDVVPKNPEDAIVVF